MKCSKSATVPFTRRFTNWRCRDGSKRNGACLTWDAGPDGETTLLALRATYEPLLDGLARHLLLPLPGWIPDPEAMDHSERGHRGTLARRLVEHLLERQSGVHARRGSVTGLDGDATLWRKLRRRLQE